MSVDFSIMRVFKGLFIILVIIPVIALIILILFSLYNYHANVIPTENLGQLEETNYRLYYSKGDNEKIISSEVNGKSAKKMEISKFGECSPDGNYTVYWKGKVNADSFYLYNFESGENIKLLDAKDDFLGHTVWTRDSSRVAIVEYPRDEDSDEKNPMIKIFNTEGKLTKTKKITKKVFKTWASDSPGALVTSVFPEIFGDATGICQTTHKIELLKDDRFEESKIDVVPPHYLGEANPNPGIFYGDKKIMPWVIGFKGYRVVRVKNTLPDGKVALAGPRSKKLGICTLSYLLIPGDLFKETCRSYLYIYDPDSESLYRMMPIQRNKEINWRYKKTEEKSTASTPAKTVKTFYENWINFDGNPMHSKIYDDSDLITKELIDQIESAEHYDPVLCAQDIPSNFNVKLASESANSSIVRVEETFGRNTKTIEVNLIKKDENWLIDEVKCSPKN